MNSTLLPPPADDLPSKKDHYGLKPKRDKTIQPLTLPTNNKPTGLNDALLEELRKKTAALAQKTPVTEIKPKLIKNVPKQPTEENEAVELVRSKIAQLYQGEPDVADESMQAEAAGNHRSKHQKFMHSLTTSGKSLESIQTEWHSYYVNLPESEKHEVWREFYMGSRGKQKGEIKSNKADTTRQVTQPIKKPRRLTTAQHAKSLLFGLSMAALSLLLVTFIFFNEAYIAPFVSPGQSVSATPIIGDLSGPVDPEPKIIIPKINLEVPVVFGLESVQESDIQNALEDGVVHYANSPDPGEKGNSVIVGHSSNNILNSGKYKFAFVLLKRLEIEDTFFVHKDGVRYTYKIYSKKVVEPTELSVLGPQERAGTITLITCDPPGTSINRLIVTAEQISPDPSKNSESSALDLEISAVDSLPSNAPSLWSRLWPF